MTATTSLLERLAREGQIPNVREWKGSWQVRVRPFPHDSYDDIHDAIAEADRRVKLREAGVRYLPSSSSSSSMTLAEAADRLLRRRDRAGGKNGPYSAKGRAHNVASLRPWRGELVDGVRVLSGGEAPAKVERKLSGRDRRRARARGGRPARAPRTWQVAHDTAGVPFALQPIGALDVVELDTWLVDRAAVAPTSATNELQGLKASLELAAELGVDVPRPLFGLSLPRRARKSTHERKRLTADELAFLGRHIDERVDAFLVLTGRAALRSVEAFKARKVDLDVFGRSIRVPAEHAKERREKVVPLTRGESAALAAYLRRPGPTSEYLIPRPGGTAWSYSGFGEDVWQPMLERAQAAWVAEHGRPNPAFEGLTLHALRRTAATLMRQAGIAPELAAERLGHSDGGALFLSTYSSLPASELRHELDRLDGDVDDELAEVVELEGRS